MAQKKQATLTSLFTLKRSGSEDAQNGAAPSPPKISAPANLPSPKQSPASSRGPSAAQAAGSAVKSAPPLGSDDSDVPVKTPYRRRFVLSDEEDIVQSSPKKVAKPAPTASPKTVPAKNPKKRAPAESESEEEDEPSDESPKGKAEKRSLATKQSPVRGAPAGAKYTPLQMQVLQVKAKNPDVLLLVECGYKYRFFGHDAEIAAKVLGIWCGEDHGMASASVPTFRLHYHLARLVNAGHKVGVVSQTETAAVKKMTKERGSSKTFARELTNLYTKGTLIESEFFTSADGSHADAASSSHLLCVFEEKAGGESGAAARVQLSAVAVQASTGDVFYDSWSDDLLRAGLEALFLQLPPSEVILPKTKLSPPTERLLEVLTTKNDIRVERIDDASFEKPSAEEKLAKFYSDKTHKAETRIMLDQLGEGPRICLAAMLDHLSKFRLDSILRATASFAPARLQFRMSLPAATLNNLELFAVSSNGQEKGSLFSIINRTKTPFGRRLLRKWLAAPLTNRAEIIARQEAVEELVSARSAAMLLLSEELRTLPDLERGICRAFYKKIGPAEFLQLLAAFEKITEAAASIKADISVKSNLLSKEVFGNFPDLKKVISFFVGSLNVEACQRNDKKEMLKMNQFPPIHALQKKIDGVRERLAEHLTDVRKLLKKPDLEYVFKQGQADYLIEVSPNEESRVPDDWIKISGIKTATRYHSPTIIECLDELALYSEQLQTEAQVAWSNLLGKFEADYLVFRAAAAKIATFDCLLSLALVAKERGFVKPTITVERTLRIKKGRNVVVEAALEERGSLFIPNDTTLDATKLRSMLITGPNMGGKSCYIRQVAQIAILAQIGSFVPAEECEMSPCDAVFTRMGAADNLEKGRSTFYIELLETSQMLASATERSLVIIDELGRGTSTFDGTAIAFATLFHLVSVLQCFTLFVTHYPVLGQLERLFPVSVANFNMSFVPEASGESSAALVTFLYKMVRGVAPSSFGLNVAHLAGLPEAVISVASARSEQMRCETEKYGIRASLLAAILEPEVFTTEELQSLQSTVVDYLDHGKAPSV